MKAKQKRVVFTVDFDAGKNYWEVTRLDTVRTTVGSAVRKIEAVRLARSLARALYIGPPSQLAQVKVKTKNGRYQYEWTYGEDPKRTKG